MAFEKLYLTNRPAPYTPATLRGAWDATAGGVTKALDVSPIVGGAIASVAVAETSTTNEYDVLLYRGVSGPLAAQTISGNLDCAIGVRSSSTSQNAHFHVHVYVTQGDSDTPRGTLLSDYREAAGTNEWPTTAAGRDLASAQAMSSLVVSAGDRLVVEIGYASRNTSSTSYTGTLWYGTLVGGQYFGDLTDTGDETTLAGIVTFSAAITEAAEAGTATQLVVETASADTAGTAVITQLVTETVSPIVVASAGLVSQVVVETISGQTVAAWLTQFVVETISRPPLYNCPGASAGPSLCGQDIILTWIEQTQTVGGSPDSLTRVVSDIALNDLADYYHGKKEPRVLEFGPITRRLSDVQGQWQGASMTWREAELDRVLRNRLLDANTRGLTATQIVCRMITQTDWADKLQARTMFIGYGTRVVPGEDRSTALEAADEVARSVEAGDEIQCPKRRLSPFYLPGLPVDAIGLPEPIIYGHLTGALSDVTPPVLTGDPARGAFVDGGVQVFGYGDLPDPPAAPTGVTLTEVGGSPGSLMLGDAPGNDWYAFVTAVDANGNESDPDTFAQRDAGSVATVEQTADHVSIQVDWDGGSPEPAFYRVYFGWNYYGVRVLQRLQVAGGVTSVTFDNCPDFTEVGLDDWTQLATGAVRSPYTFFADWAVSAVVAGEETALSALGKAQCEGYRRPVHVEWVEVPGATEYRVYRRAYAGAPWDRRWSVDATGSPGPVGSPPVFSFDDDLLDTGVSYIADAPAARGVVPVIYVGQETLTVTGETWYRFLVCGHAVTAIDAWYLDGVREDVGTAGVDYLIPGYAGWTDRFGADTFRDLNGRRYTLIYARGPKGDALAGVGGSPVTTGAATSVLTLNVQGIEGSAAADGSGALITDLHDQYVHWMINFGPLGDYQTGGWLPAPTWAPLADHCRINIDSFLALKAYAATVVAGGYVGGGYLGELATLRDWMARWCLSIDARLGQNASGQWTVTRQVPDPATAPARSYTEVRHVQAGSVRLDPIYDEHWNTIPYQYRPDPAAGTWEVADQVAVALDSVATYGEVRTGPALDLWFVRSSAVATDILTRVLLRHADPPLRVVFDTIDLCGTLSDLGEVIGLTHTAGPGPDGWDQATLFVDGVIVRADVARTTLETRALVAPHQAL